MPPPPHEDEAESEIEIDASVSPVRLRVRFDDYEAYLLYLLSQRPDLLAEVERIGLKPQDWLSPEWRQLYEMLLFEMPMSGAEVEALFEDLPNMLHTLATDLLNHYHDKPLPNDADLIAEARRTALRIRRAAIERELKEIAFVLRDAVAEGDKAKMKRLVAQRKALQHEQKQIDERIRTPNALPPTTPDLEEEDDFF